MEDFNILEDALNAPKKIEAPKPEPQPETHESFKAAAEETIKNESPEPKPEPIEKPKEQIKAPEEDIFSILSKGTEEDANMKSGGFSEKMQEMVSDISGGGSEPDSFTECKIKAEAHIGLIDVGFSVAACFILKDFSDSVYAKFSLSSERRKVLIQSMARMYQQMKMKSNPKVELALLIAGSYVPLIWLLFMTKKRRMEEAKNPQPLQPAFLPDESQAPVIPIPTQNQYYDQFGAVQQKKRGPKPGKPRGPYNKNK